MSDQENKIEAGDVVRFKSGGPQFVADSNEADGKVTIVRYPHGGGCYGAVEKLENISVVVLHKERSRAQERAINLVIHNSILATQLMEAFDKKGPYIFCEQE